MPKPRRAFSLVELLCVIGIIAVLLAMLLPVLGRVRGMARSTVCLARLQQMSNSFQMYANSNRNHSFANATDLTQPAWWELLQPYNGSLSDTLLCPQATDPGNVIGSANMAWGPSRTFAVTAPQWIQRNVCIGSYGLNSWLYEDPSKQPGFFQDGAIRLPAHEAPHIPVFADCIMSDGLPQDTDTVPADLIHPIPFYSGYGPRPTGPKGSMAMFCIDRHHHAINVAFLDGHAESITLADLWKLHWSNDFQPRDVVVP